MKDIKSIFSKVEKQLKKSSWFGNEWEVYNRGEYLQLYKINWHNESQGGVHFETYIEADQIKQKKFPICMHAEESCPSQEQFIKKFLEIERDLIKSWKGYKIIGTGYSICKRELPLNLKNLDQRILEELNRLRKLENIIDQVLRSL